MIRDGEQLRQAEADLQAMWQFLEAARETHSAADYQRLSTPYLLQIQERQQEILDYLSVAPEPLRT